VLVRDLDELSAISATELLARRYQKFRNMGQSFVASVAS
jgi:acetyl-CoA carboxylase alpha subunit